MTVMIIALAALAAAPAASNVQYQPLPPVQPAPVQVQAPAPPALQVAPALVRPVERVLPAATMVSLTALQEISSKHVKQGEQFQFAVVSDVTENGVVVIPRGSIAIGVISMKTGRAVGGKSGKFDVTFQSVTANGVTFPLSGVFHQEGKGNTLGALFGSIVISGHSAVLQPGQVLTAFTSARTAY